MLFTIVIPIYNAELYVKRCISCILSQTYSDIELIAVDDGSTDCSGAILDAIAKKDNRLKVIHKQNEGVGKARNEGIIKAKGRYIYFMDIDDMLSDSFLDVSASIIYQYNEPDLLVFGFNVVGIDYKERVHISNKYIDSREELTQCYTEDLFKVKYGSGFLWNKLFKRSIIYNSNIKFGTFRIMEDELFIIDYMKCINSALLYDKAFYTYYINNAGNSRSKYIHNQLEIITDVYYAFLDLRISLCIKDDEFRNHLDNRTFMALMNWIRQCVFHTDNPLSKQKKKTQLKNLHNGYIWQSIYTHISTQRLTIENKMLIHAIERESLTEMWIITKAYAIIRYAIKQVHTWLK